MRALLVPAAVMMLMVSIGMSLRPRGLLAGWRSLTPKSWIWLLPGADERVRAAPATSTTTWGSPCDALPAVAWDGLTAVPIMTASARSARREAKPALRPGGGA